MKYDAIIWDWNGTLLDDVDVAVGIVNEVLAEYGVARLSTDRYRDVFEFPVTRYYERVGLDASRHNFDTISEKFCARFEAEFHRVPLFPDTTATLGAIRQSGVRQYLLSGTEHHSLQRMVQRAGALEFFTAAHGLDNMMVAGKQRAAEDLVRRYGLNPSSTIVIGDTTHDADMARHIGADCMLLASGHHSRDRLGAAKFPLFDSLSALFEKIR